MGSLKVLFELKTISEIALFLIGVMLVFGIGFIFGKLIEKIFHIHLS